MLHFKVDIKPLREQADVRRFVKQIATYQFTSKRGSGRKLLSNHAVKTDALTLEMVPDQDDNKVATEPEHLEPSRHRHIRGECAVGIDTSP